MQRKFLAAIAAVLMITGCTTVDPVTGERTANRTANAAIIGAIGGAVLGTAAGGDDRRNAIIGAGIGALGGAAVGHYMYQNYQNLRARLAGTGVGVTRVNEAQILLNFPSDITFDLDRADVKGQFVPTLRDVAGVLSQYPQTTLDVYGHADCTGSDAHNQDLSERRAMAVSSVLINGGVMGQRIIATGYGETRLLDAGNCASPANRRVEVLISAFQG